MFQKILAPVDLAHVDALKRALDAAAALAQKFDASIVYVGVAAAAPSALAHTPAEYAAKLDAFAAEQAAAHGIATSAKAYVSHDPATDVSATVLAAIPELGADLVVMATHVPTLADHLWPSHGGRIATETDISILLVRP